MCASSITALDDLKQLVSSAQGYALSDAEKSQYDACKDALGNIKRFSNFLSNCPSATNMWLDSLMNKEEATPIAERSMLELKSTLATLPMFSDEDIKICHKGHKKDDNNSENELDSQEDAVGEKIKTLQQIRKDYGTIVASVRSSVKVISLTFESQRGLGDVSSKTD